MKPSVLERNIELLLTRSYRIERASPELRARIAASVENELTARVERERAARTARTPARPRPQSDRATPRWRRPMVALAAGLAAVLFAAGAWLVWRANEGRRAGEPVLADGRAMFRVKDTAAWRVLSDDEVRSGIDIEAQHVELRTAAHATARLWFGAAGRVDAAADTEIVVDARRAPDDLGIELVRGSLELERYAAGKPWTVHSRHGDVVLERGAVTVASAASVPASESAGAVLSPAGGDVVCARLLRGAASVRGGADTKALDVERDACLSEGRVLPGLDALASAPARESAITSGVDTKPAVSAGAIDGEASGGLLRCTVECADEAPAQVTVTFLRHERLPKVSEPKARACSVADGTFEVRDISPGTYRVCVAAAGFALWQIPEVEFTPGAEPVVLNVRLERGAHLRGRVVDARNGRPIADALVLSERDTPVQVLAFELEDGPSPDWPSWARTQADGSFEIAHLSYGKHVLRATRKGWAAGWTSSIDVVRDGPARDVVIELDQGSAIFGRVADDDGSPSPGAVVIASVMDISFDRPCMSFGHGVADAEGAYRIDDLPVGSYVILNVSRAKQGQASEGALDSLVSSARIARPGSEVEVDLPGSDAGTRFRGRLVGEDGAPRAGLDVSLQRVDHPESTGWLAARSASDGSFQFARVEPAAYDLYVGENLGAEFVYQCTVEIPKVPDFTFDVRLASGVLVVRALDAAMRKSPGECATILERLTDRGFAFAGRNVTSADGVARFSHLPDGIYRAQVFALRGRYGAESTPDTTLGPSARQVTVDVELRPGAALDIVTVDALGRSIARASVKFVDAAGTSTQFNPDDTTDNNGRLHVQGMKPGRWTVIVEHAAYRPLSTVVDLEVGDARELTIPLELSEGSR